MQKIYADHYGPFLGKVYALVIEDALSRYPEVFLIIKTTADSTMTAFRKFLTKGRSASSGVHRQRITLQRNGDQVLLSIRRMPPGLHGTLPSLLEKLAERFVRTLKTALLTNALTTVVRGGTRTSGRLVPVTIPQRDPSDHREISSHAILWTQSPSLA